MAGISYATLQTKVAGWLNRDDLTSVIPDFINIAMHDMERIFSFRYMKVRTTVAIVLNDYLISNPVTNYKELIQDNIIDSSSLRYNLSRKSYAYAVKEFPDFLYGYGRPQILAEVTDIETPPLTTDALPIQKLLIRPTADQSYTLEIWAYQYSPDLDGVTYTTNWWTQYAWETLLYGALAEANAYLNDDVNVSKYKAMRDAKLKNLMDAETAEEASGSNPYMSSDYVV